MGRSFTGPLAIGVDVGSTTVKAVVIDPQTMEILWSDYQRHNTKQPEKVAELLEAIEASFPESPSHRWRIFLTGSGASPLCTPLGA
jgi:activator of 2-hydroxyglutaryl-CoA dehydratase